MKVAIITGVSGGGKSKAADWFEDHGYYCIDNMPPQLVKNFIELSANKPDAEEQKVAFVIDIRGTKEYAEIEKCINNLRAVEGVESTVLYVDASTSTLVKRYNESRRNHPLNAGKATAEVIEKEKQILEGVRKSADFVIDTTRMKVPAFNAELAKAMLGESDQNTFTVNISSFGFKYGIPAESDIQVDMRFIPNPYYVKSLKNLTGNNKKVSEYVLKYDVSKEFIKNFHATVSAMIPGYIAEGKYHINIAFGCTGGHHRSVAMANEFAKIFTEEGYRVTLVHRDLDFVAKGDKK